MFVYVVSLGWHNNGQFNPTWNSYTWLNTIKYNENILSELQIIAALIVLYICSITCPMSLLLQKYHWVHHMDKLSFCFVLYLSIFQVKQGSITVVDVCCPASVATVNAVPKMTATVHHARHLTKQSQVTTRGPIQCLIRTRWDVLKSRRFEILQVPRQQYCRDRFQISELLKNQTMFLFLWDFVRVYSRVVGFFGSWKLA